LKVFEIKLGSHLLKIFFFLVLGGNILLAQDGAWNSVYQKTLLPGTDTLQVDSLVIIPSSLKFKDKDQNELKLNFEFVGDKLSTLVFHPPLTDTVNLVYSAIPINLNKTFKNKDTALILPEITQINRDLYQVNSNSTFKPFEGLNSKGSISRGITIGSNQDAVLNSSLNLQLAGKLGRDTEIRASITDNNIPVQSDGFTQQLREFDRVYIELENKDFGLLRAGDYNMTSRSNRFLQFDKRISGAGLFTKIPLQNEGAIPLSLEAGIARGRFARNRFPGQEGNQGPYKLTGANGEQFIIIISGSEKVYIDGILMKRGQQYDYIMDYNAGEIIFTSLQPITKEKRIAVEFQYTEQNYLRSVAFANTGFQNSTVKTNIQFYSEQDSKNQSLVQDLSDEEKAILEQVGDAIDNAFISTIAPSNYQANLVQYELMDSLGIDSVLVFSTDSNATLFFASFTFLGENRGDYNLSQNNANGRVFEWVAPINGLPQGSYAPVKQLIAPNQIQILTAETEVRISKNQNLRVDVAASNNDINLFSDAGKQNDIGLAGKFDYEIKGKWGEQQWFTNLGYEFNQNNFRTIERIRRIEFARDWNLPLNYNGETQISGLALGMSDSSYLLRYDFNALNIEGYQGFKNQFSTSWSAEKSSLKSNLSWLFTTDTLRNSNFLREQFEYRYLIWKNVWVGIRSIGELNDQKNNSTDTLIPSSYRFLQNEFFIGVGDTANNFAELSYLQRLDDTASQGIFRNFSRANTLGLRSSIKTNFNSRIQVFANLRELKIRLPEELPIERTITSRINYLQKFFGSAIISTTFYETGAGSEARRSFSYVEVPSGTGVYTHTDYNNNGIQELDEFEIAPTPDQATFVRVFTPSNEFVRTNLNKFGQNLNINAPNSWKNKEDFRKGVSYFSLLINYQLDRKTLLSGSSNSLNPFAAVEDDTLIVTLNNSFRNTVFFNRSSSIFGLEYTYLRTDNRNLLSFGVERRSKAENSFGLRYRFLKPLLFNTNFTVGGTSNSSQNFTTRNFNIDEVSNTYSITYQPHSRFTTMASFSWSDQSAVADENNQLSNLNYGLNLNYNLAESVSATGELNYIVNTFEGNVNTPAAFEMLEGLRPGENGTWSLNIQKTIRKNIQLSLNYTGRISEDSFPVNTGSVQIKAFF
jgi:hypothetical protein